MPAVWHSEEYYLELVLKNVDLIDVDGGDNENGDGDDDGNHENEIFKLQREDQPKGFEENMFFKHLGNKIFPQESEAFYT